MHNTGRVKELRFAINSVHIHIETILSTSTFCPLTQRAFSQYAFKWIELSVECFLRNKTNKSNAIWFKVSWRYHRGEKCNTQKKIRNWTNLLDEGAKSVSVHGTRMRTQFRTHFANAHHVVYGGFAYMYLYLYLLRIQTFCGSVYYLIGIYWLLIFWIFHPTHSTRVELNINA